MPIYKRCPRCGTRLLSAESCPKCKRLYEKKQNDKYTLFYNMADWRKAKQLCINRLAGIDWYEYFTNGRLVNGDTVHHIIPIKDDFSLRLTQSNLIYLTNSNHQLVHKELDAGSERREAIIKALKDALDKWGRGYGKIM